VNETERPTEDKEVRPRPRIEQLSDLIFGLAMSIGAIALIGTNPTSPQEVESSLLAFAFSFIILIGVWLRYTRAMSVLEIESSRMLRLNSFLLFLVAVEPYLFNLIFGFNASTHSSAFEAFTSSLYALDLAGISFSLSAFSFLASLAIKGPTAEPHSRSLQLGAVSGLATGIGFLISIVPEFWTWTLFGVRLRYVVWFLALLIMWLRQGAHLFPRGTE
jgi:uncharacterized membrane protein